MKYLERKNDLQFHVFLLQKLLLYSSACNHSYELQVHRIVPQHSPLVISLMSALYVAQLRQDK
jgi:hypothetical protein